MQLKGPGATTALRAVLLDAGGVLIKHSRGPYEVYLRWEEKLGVPRNTIIDAISIANEESVPQDVMWEAVRVKLGATADELAALHADLVSLGPDQWDEELVAYVRRLRGRAKTAIVSNAGTTSYDHARKNGYDDLVDAWVISESVGVTKPHPAIYQAALEELEVTASAALFIDDSPRNIAGAEAVGIRTHLHTGVPTTISTIEAFLAENADLS